MINIEASMKTILNFKSFCERILKPTSTPTSLITVFNFHEAKNKEEEELTCCHQRKYISSISFIISKSIQSDQQRSKTEDF